MAISKTDAETPRTGAVKKWDGNAERDLCLAMIMGNSEGDRVRTDWNTTHNIMVSLGYDFSKDAMSQRWSKTIYKDFKSRHKDELPAPLSPKNTSTKRKKAAEAAAAAADDAAPAEEAAAGAVAGSTPPATPTTAKGRKRTPAKPKAAGTPAKPRGRKPKSAATVKTEEDEDTEQPASANKDANVKTEDTEQHQPSPAKKAKAEPEGEDTEMADEA